MAKTYTYTLQQGEFLGGRNNGKFAYDPTFGLYEGYFRLGCSSNGSTAYGWQYCINAPFTPSVIGTAASVKLKLTHTAPNYNAHIRVARKNAAGTGSFTYTDIAESYAAKGATTTTIDLTSTGIPTYGYILYADSSGYANTYVTVSKVELTIVTNASDYTLTYNANGGTSAPSAQTVTVAGSGSVKLSSAVPVRDNHIFKGWAKSATATEAQYQPGDTITIGANTTLYAVWAVSSVIRIMTEDGLKQGQVYVQTADGMKLGIVYVQTQNGLIQSN